MLAQAHTTPAVWWSHRAQEIQGSLPPDWSRQRVPPFFAESSGLYNARMRAIRVSVLMMIGYESGVRRGRLYEGSMKPCEM